MFKRGNIYFFSSSNFILKMKNKNFNMKGGHDVTKLFINLK